MCLHLNSSWKSEEPTKSDISEIIYAVLITNYVLLFPNNWVRRLARRLILWEIWRCGSRFMTNYIITSIFSLFHCISFCFWNTKNPKLESIFRGFFKGLQVLSVILRSFSGLIIPAHSLHCSSLKPDIQTRKNGIRNHTSGYRPWAFEGTKTNASLVCARMTTE